jgi:type I restriction enzyme M protein
MPDPQQNGKASPAALAGEVTLSRLESHLWEAANILRGPVDAADFQGYEYLIKKFADDSGHTAAEFYTNRTVVQLMTEMLDVQPGESVYDPTCGSGGMLPQAH